MVKRAGALALLLAAQAAAAPADLLLEAQLTPAQVALQTQATYRLRLYQGIALRGVVVGEPQAPLAEVRRIGERVYEAVREGRRYRVHERSYAVFPFASGSLAIPGVEAGGEIMAAGGWRTVRVAAPPQVLKVLPVPANAGVAARALRLSETWSAAAEGGIWRRAIRIEAQGVEAAQLPEIRFTVPGATVHPEPARLAESFRGDVVVATREQSYGIVLQHPGEVVAPELRVAWWNADLPGAAVAVLPARILQAAAPPRTAGEAPGVPRGAFAGAAVLCFAALAWHRRYAMRAALRWRRACRSGDLRAVRDELLAWGRAMDPQGPPLTLVALAARLGDAAARDALGEIDRRLYGPAGKSGTADLVRLAATAKRGLRPLPPWRTVF